MSLLFLMGFFLVIGCGEKEKQASKGSPDKKKEEGLPAKYNPDSLQKELEELNERIKKNPQNADLYYQRAGVKKRQGNIQLAIEDMKRALRIDSTRSDLHQRMGTLYFRNRNVKRSKKHFRRAIALDGENTKAYIGLADLYRATRQYQNAIDYANEALKVDPHLARPYTIKGLVHQQTGDTSKAISSFRTTVEMDPKNYAAFLQLGYLMAARDRDLAIEYYNTAHRLQPQDPRPLYNKAYYLKEHGRPDKAIKTYKELIGIDTGYVEAYYDIGHIHLVQKDDPRKGLEWFNKTIDLSPEYHQALYNRGLCYEKLGKKDSAIADYRKALRIKENFRLAAKGLQRLGAKYQGDR
ncbi:MAG: tetratricopeptide repeat protein [Flavobacteriales bacterium]